MKTNMINVPNAYTKYFKKWSIFTITCESDFSKIHTCFPTINYLQIAEFVTECLKTDTRTLKDEQALTAILQPGAEHVPFTVCNIQFHLYYTEILEPVFI